MMKLLFRLFVAFCVLVVVLLAVSFFLPRTYRVERSITIAAAPETVFPKVADLREWKAWGVWFERDPQMKVTYSENPASVGGWSAWESKTEGSGKATLTTVTPSSRAVYGLEFPDMGSKSTGSFVLTPDGAGVKVTWSDEGDFGNNPAFRWVGLFIDKLLGPDFEAGLAKLKRVSEAQK